RPHVALRRRPADHAGAAIQFLVRPGHLEAQGVLRPGAPMTEYREADLSRLKTVPIAQRSNKVDATLLAHPPGSDRSFAAFWTSLPDILAAKDLRFVVDRIAAAAGKQAVVAMLGGHVIKVGLGPLLIALLRRRVLTHVAMNGSAAIHDFELAAYGAALGASSHRDFRRLAAALPALDGGGVVLNLGSAVVMPEVFLKALTIARNLNGGKPAGFTAVDCDMQRHYRPRVNVVERPTRAGGRGIMLTGHHELLF